MGIKIIYFRVLALFMLFSMISCQSEEMFLKGKHIGQKSSVVTKYLTGKEAKNVAEILKKELRKNGVNDLNSTKTDSKTKTDSYMRMSDGEIDFNNILLVLDTLGIKNYTFKIINHPDDDYKTFHNLVLTEKESELKLTIMKYEMTEMFAQDYYLDLKSFYEFQGKITAKGFSSVIDPCEEVIVDYPSSGGSTGGGGYSGPPSDGGGAGGSAGGSSSCVNFTVEFECSCGRTYGSWASYTGSFCGDGSNPGYGLTIVIRYYNVFCRLSNEEPCNPDGSIGVIDPKLDCNTSKEDLKLVFPNTPDNVLEEVAKHINDYGKAFGIDTKEKLQHFLSQAGHESTNLSGTEFGSFTENLNFRVNKLGTEDYWEKYFNPITNPTEDPNKANPNDYASSTSTTFVNHEMFANYVYDDANRSVKGKLGNVNIGDGYKFIGRGIIQLTGRENYTTFNDFYRENYDNSVNLIDNPELVASDMKIAVISALWYFKNRVLDMLNPPLNDTTTCKKVTCLVNGGTKGLVHRNSLFVEAQNHINCL